MPQKERRKGNAFSRTDKQSLEKNRKMKDFMFCAAEKALRKL